MSLWHNNDPFHECNEPKFIFIHLVINYYALWNLKIGMSEAEIVRKQEVPPKFLRKFLMKFICELNSFDFKIAL